MNDKIKVAIAIAVGLVGGGILSTLGGGSEVTKNTLLGSKSVPNTILVGDFPEWTRNGSAFRCQDGKVQGCIGGSNCGTAGRTGTDQPVAVCQKCVNWIDIDELLTDKPDFNTNMLLQVDPNYGPN